MTEQAIIGEVEEFAIPLKPLEVIFSKQKEFGKKFCPFGNFRDELERVYWIRVFLDCIDDELAEVRSWLPWKHWKKYTDFELNETEIRFELIDILHFVVSLALVEGKSADSIFNDSGTSDLNELLAYCMGHLVSSSLIIPTNDSTKVKLTIFTLREMNFYTGMYDHLTKGQGNQYTYLYDLFHHLFGLMAVWDMTEAEVYNYYSTKNKINHKRQEEGY